MAADDRAQQPIDGDERAILTGWLVFHRDALSAKCDGLTDDQLVERPVEPSTLSLFGLVRHMAEMERAYGVWALGPKAELEWVWGSYENDAEDDIDCDVTMVGESMRVWREEMRRTDDALGSHATLDEVCDGNGLPFPDAAKSDERSRPPRGKVGSSVAVLHAAKSDRA